ncbi:hypothetical protein D3C78_672840 [compost metagenome]
MLIIWHQQLDRTLGTHLVEVFGDTRHRLRPHDPRDGQPGGRHREHQQGDHLKAQANVHDAVQAQASAKVAAHQIGDDTEDLVEQKQCSDLQWRVAQRVEMQHHQHAQRAIGKGKGPVVTGYHQVLAHWRGKG